MCDPFEPAALATALAKIWALSDAEVDARRDKAGSLLAILALAGFSGIDAVRAETAELAAAAELAAEYAQERRAEDYAALESYRPGYAFWQHVFTIPDGHIAYGSGRDGRLLAVFPITGDWTAGADWKDPGLAHLLDGVTLAKRLDDRRDQVAGLLAAMVGPVLHNPTRGQFLLPNARRYGRFLDEWGAIYERFGVPAEIGMAQAAI